MEELTAEQALRVAARDGDEGTVLRLLEAGTPVDAADMIGYTPLMLAARKGQANMVRLLLLHGADWKAKNRPRNNALDFAVRSESVECIQLLLELEGDITGYRGRYLLSYVHNADLEQVLRQAGAIDEVARMSIEEADVATRKLLEGETVLCEVCEKPLKYLWPGNSKFPSYGIYCPDGCTVVEESWGIRKG